MSALVSRALRFLCLVALVCALAPFADARRQHVEPTAEIPAAELPREARDTLARIASGGPYRYDRDGVVFGNFERLLPPQPRGYYHEFTVPTPGASTRGARRIVCGGNVRSLTECYYSDDHYRSFRRIRP